MPNARHSREAIVEIQDEEVIIAPQEQNEAETVPVRLLRRMIVEVIGEITKNHYIFNGAGSIVNVDKSDLGSITRKNVAKPSCCGSYSSPYFEILS